MKHLSVFVVLTTILGLSSSAKLEKRSLVPLFTSNPLFRKFFSHQYDTYSPDYSQDYEQQYYYQPNVQPLNPDAWSEYGNSHEYENQDNGSLEFENQEYGDYESENPEYGNQEYGIKNNVYPNNIPTSTTDEYRPENQPLVCATPATEEIDQNENVGVKFNSLPRYDRTHIFASKPTFVGSAFYDQNEEDEGPVFNSLPWYDRNQIFKSVRKLEKNKTHDQRGVNGAIFFNSLPWYDRTHIFKSLQKFEKNETHDQSGENGGPIFNILPWYDRSQQFSPHQDRFLEGVPNVEQGHIFKDVRPGTGLDNKSTKLGEEPDWFLKLVKVIKSNSKFSDQQWNLQVLPYMRQQLAFMQLSPFYKRPNLTTFNLHHTSEQFNPSEYLGGLETSLSGPQVDHATNISPPSPGNFANLNQVLEYLKNSSVHHQHINSQIQEKYDQRWNSPQIPSYLKQQLAFTKIPPFYKRPQWDSFSAHQNFEQFRPSAYAGNLQIPSNGPLPAAAAQILSPYIGISPYLAQQIEFSKLSPLYNQQLDFHNVSLWHPVSVHQNLEQLHPITLGDDSKVHLTDRNDSTQGSGNFNILPHYEQKVYNQPLDFHNVSLWHPVSVHHTLEQLHPITLGGDSKVHLTGRNDSTQVSGNFNILPHYEQKVYNQPLDFHNVSLWHPVSVHHNLEQLHPITLGGDSKVHLTDRNDSTQVSGKFNILPPYDQKVYNQPLDFHNVSLWHPVSVHQNLEQLHPITLGGDSKVHLTDRNDSTQVSGNFNTLPHYEQKVYNQPLDFPNVSLWHPVSVHQNLEQLHPITLGGDSEVHLTGRNDSTQVSGNFNILPHYEQKVYNQPLDFHNVSLWHPVSVHQNLEQLHPITLGGDSKAHLTDRNDSTQVSGNFNILPHYEQKVYNQPLDFHNVSLWHPVSVHQNLEQLHPITLGGDSKVHLTDRNDSTQVSGKFNILPPYDQKVYNQPLDFHNVSLWHPVSVHQNLEQLHPITLGGDSKVHLTDRNDSTQVSGNFNTLPHYEQKVYNQPLDFPNVSLWHPVSVHQNLEQLHPITLGGDSEVHLTGRNDSTQVSGNFNILPHYEQKVYNQPLDFHNVSLWHPVSVHQNLEQLHPITLGGDSKVHLTGRNDSTRMSGNFNILPHYDQKVDFHHSLHLGVRKGLLQKIALETLGKTDFENTKAPEIPPVAEQSQKFAPENFASAYNVSSKLFNVGPVLFLSRIALINGSSTSTTEPNFVAKISSHIEHSVASTTLEDSGVKYTTTPRISENTRSKIPSSSENLVSTTTAKILETTNSIPFVPKRDKTGLPSVNRKVIFNPGFTNKKVSRFDQDPELEELVDDQDLELEELVDGYFKNFGERLQPRNKTITVADLPLDHSRTSGFQFVLADSYGQPSAESGKAEWNKRNA